ncbi:MAG: STAS domain-containing protein [Ruminiclostridium sp.]|nr:STAS domain-containing protein [Ruminiclostridium sp.]
MGKLNLTTNRENDTLTVQAVGRIDTGNYIEFEKAINAEIDGVKNIVLDFEKLDYISSSGLRVLISLHKMLLSEDGKLTVRHPTTMVREVFDVTGFTEMINIEN